MELFCDSLTYFPHETNLWLLLAMVAREQVDDYTGPQRGNESAPVIGDFGLLPQHHLQQSDTNSPSTAFYKRFHLQTVLGFDLLGIYLEKIFILGSVGGINLKKTKE